MNPSNYYFSTPMVNPDCPFGLPNPCVLITTKHLWDAGQHIAEDNPLSAWMRKKGFGELMPNFYQTDNVELMTPEAVIMLLSMQGMTHNPDLDPALLEGIEA